MLKDKLDFVQIACGTGNTCSTYKLAASLDDETRKSFIDTLLSNVSTRRLHMVLQSEGIAPDRNSLGQQRKCMKTDACKCDWDSLS